MSTLRSPLQHPPPSLETSSKPLTAGQQDGAKRQTLRHQTMRPCNLCPRQCNVDRSRTLGWCKMDDRIHISSIVIHRGEEPPISGEKGIVNIFFPSCNMQCIYCQNREISCRGTQGTVMSCDEACNAIIELASFIGKQSGICLPIAFCSTDGQHR